MLIASKPFFIIILVTNRSTKSFYSSLLLPSFKLQVHLSNYYPHPLGPRHQLDFLEWFYSFERQDGVKLDEGLVVLGALLPNDGQWLEERDWLCPRET